MFMCMWIAKSQHRNHGRIWITSHSLKIVKIWCLPSAVACFVTLCPLLVHVLTETRLDIFENLRFRSTETPVYHSTWKLLQLRVSLQTTPSSKWLELGYIPCHFWSQHHHRHCRCRRHHPKLSIDLSTCQVRVMYRHFATKDVRCLTDGGYSRAKTSLLGLEEHRRTSPPQKWRDSCRCPIWVWWEWTTCIKVKFVIVSKSSLWWYNISAFFLGWCRAWSSSRHL